MTLTSTSALNIVQWITRHFSSFEKFCSPWELELKIEPVVPVCHVESPTTHHKETIESRFHSRKNKKICKLGMLTAFVDIHSWYLTYLANSWVQRPSKQFFFNLRGALGWARHAMDNFCFSLIKTRKLCCPLHKREDDHHWSKVPQAACQCLLGCAG